MNYPCDLKSAELNLDALQDYKDQPFQTKNTFASVDFSRTVSLKTGAKDFLNDPSYKED